MNVFVNGRLPDCRLPALKATAKMVDGNITVRIDSGACDEFWVEAYLDSETLDLLEDESDAQEDVD